MALIHAVAIRNGFCNDIAAAIDGGGGVGQMVLKAGVSVVATIPFEATAFTGPSAGVLTLDVGNTPTDPSAVGHASPVDGVELQDNAATPHVVGDNVTAPAGGGDIELSKNPIAALDVVEITSYSYTASP